MEKIKCIEVYKDTILGKIVTEGKILNELYKEEGKELTEDRVRYLVDTRKLCERIIEENKADEAEPAIVEENKADEVEPAIVEEEIKEKIKKDIKKSTK